MIEIVCKTCDQGCLFPKKIYRLSAPLVFIGYIFLVPAFLGMGMSLNIAVAAFFMSDDQKMNTEITSELLEAGFNNQDITSFLKNKELPDESYQKLSEEQKQKLESVRQKINTENIGKGMGFFFVGLPVLLFFVSSLFSGVIGWLLTMKKEVLRCNACGAITPRA